ncbi:phage tail tape measure protein [Cytobacillus sp. FSL W8-0315]|uniref:phage tail tape measure protein n=1 Tax=Cytobacillus sp. FSL W8-0315 TaxID=2921600 RepID=UPI0030FB541B
MATELGELRAKLTLQAQEFQRGIQQTRTSLLSTANSTRATSRAMSSLSSSTSSLSQAARNGIVPATELAGDLEDRIGSVNELSGETANTVSDLGGAVEELGPAAEEGAGSAAASIEEMLSTIQKASLAIGGAIVAGVGVSVKQAADFEFQMTRVKAISGATEEEFQSLNETALELGASTSKSASEVAIAFEDMAAKGFNANQIIEAMPGVIAAAEASGSDLALTADVVASALNGFQMEAAEASKVADILATAANISAASVDDMGYAFKYVGPVANSLGLNIEEVSAAIGIMTNAGLDGSNAGTALRAALLALNNPAKEQEKMMKNLGFSMQDSNGEAKSLAEIFGDLAESTKDMTQAEKVATVAKLVGTEASAGMLAVMDGGVNQLNEFTKSLQNSAGASKEAADIMKDNLRGAVDELTGAFETLSINVGNEFLPMLTDVTQKGAEVLSAIGEMDTSAVKTGVAFAGTASAIALVISTVGKLAIATKGLMASMGPAGWLITGLSLLGGALVAAKVHQEDMKEVTLETANTMIENADALSLTIDKYDQLSQKSKLSTDELGRFLDINSEIAKTADPNVIARLKDEQEKLREKSGLSNEEFNEMLKLNQELIEKVPETNATFTDQGNAIAENTNKAKEYNAQQMEMIRLELEAQKTKAEANMAEYLEEESKIKDKIHSTQEKINLLNQQEIDQSEKLRGLQQELATAKANNDIAEQERLTETIEMENRKLEGIKKQQADEAQIILSKTKQLDKIQSQIGKLDEVKRKMVDIELKQVGINAKRGEEMRALDSAISKLETQKQKLQNNTPVAQRNTEEYRRSVSAIQSQIDNLNSVKSRISEITGQAQSMNRTIGSTIYKDIVIREKRYALVTTPGQSGRVPEGLYHTGGIVGRGQMPKLHVGGLASQFANAPQHNEIDVRLLRNEMVLTEAQQANLMRMIDAGLTGNGGSLAAMDPEVINLLRQIERGISQGLSATIIMNEREVARAITPLVTENQAQNKRLVRSNKGQVRS